MLWARSRLWSSLQARLNLGYKEAVAVTAALCPEHVAAAAPAPAVCLMLELELLLPLWLYTLGCGGSSGSSLGHMVGLASGKVKPWQYRLLKWLGEAGKLGP